MSQSETWYIREELDHEQVMQLYNGFPNLFSFQIHHGDRLTNPPGRTYVSGRINYVDLINIDLFSVHEVSLMINELAGNDLVIYHYLNPKKYINNGIEELGTDSDVLWLSTHVEEHKLIELYATHGLNNIKEYFNSPTKPQDSLTIEEIDDPGPYALVPASTVFKSVGSHCNQGGQSCVFGQSSIVGGQSSVFGQSGIGGQSSVFG
ncbi:hypothetical protein Hdeb2414_s0003g00090721 [Helianthus debilis subsp. tardiflorus]